MRSHTDIDTERQRVIVRFTGTMDLRDILETMSTSAKARVLNFPTLFDAHDVPMTMAPSDPMTIAESLQQLATTKIAPCAVVVCDQEAFNIVTHVGRALEGMAKVQAFFSREDAEQWLGWRSAEHRQNPA